ncbi:MAG: cupin domain-containing protein [Betaproteobacteria bacterium]
MKTAYADISSFITMDGSIIRELMHPATHRPSRMSFAEAIVEPGGATLTHLHREAEEIYHITQGVGTMRLGEAEFAIASGDTIAIPPGTSHNVTNTGIDELKILCVCHPAYADADTVLL